MKITKSALKSLIKECLVEILVEGLDVSSESRLREAVTRSDLSQRQQNRSQHNRISTQQKQSSHLVEAVKISAGGDSVLENILADTAATTYQKQKNNELPSIDSMRLNEATISNDGINNDNVQSNWANLAFSKSSKPSPEKLAALGFNLPT